MAIVLLIADFCLILPKNIPPSVRLTAKQIYFHNVSQENKMKLAYPDNHSVLHNKYIFTALFVYMCVFVLYCIESKSLSQWTIQIEISYTIRNCLNCFISNGELRWNFSDQKQKPTKPFYILWEIVCIRMNFRYMIYEYFLFSAIYFFFP